MSSRPSASQLQDEPAAGRGCTPATHGGSQRGRMVPKELAKTVLDRNLDTDDTILEK